MAVSHVVIAGSRDRIALQDMNDAPGSCYGVASREDDETSEAADVPQEGEGPRGLVLRPSKDYPVLQILVYTDFLVLGRALRQCQCQFVARGRALREGHHYEVLGGVANGINVGRHCEDYYITLHGQLPRPTRNTHQLVRAAPLGRAVQSGCG